MNNPTDFIEWQTAADEKAGDTNMLWNILIIAVLGFLGYAIWTYYASTPGDQSVASRIWAAILLAIGAAGAWIAAFFQQGGVPGT